MQNEIEYHSKFLKDFQKEKGKNVLPDFDEIYKRYDNLKSILTELEEWLKGRIEWNKSILKEDAGKSDLLGFNFHREAYIKIWEDTLDKIQELKEKYK